MQKIIVFSVLFVLVSVFSANETFGLESDTEYFLSSDSIYLIFQVDATNENTLTDGGITINDTFYEIDTEQVKVWRVTDDGDYGRIFGKTTSGDNYYLIYDVNGFDGKILFKVWMDGKVTRVIEDVEIDKLF